MRDLEFALHTDHVPLTDLKPTGTPAGFTHALEEPVHISTFSAAYDRKFNTGDFSSLNPAIIIWVKTRVAEGEAFDLHDAKWRLRQMARENVRAQWLRYQERPEAVFLGLRPPAGGPDDPITVRTVSVSLTRRMNLGDYQSITPGYTDWADVRHAAHSPTELHIALQRMWNSLWVNVEDEIARARGEATPDAFFGLPEMTVDDLTRRPTPAANGGR